MHFDHEVAMRGGDFTRYKSGAVAFSVAGFIRLGRAPQQAPEAELGQASRPGNEYRIKASSVQIITECRPVRICLHVRPGPIVQTGLGQAIGNRICQRFRCTSASDPALAEIVRRWWMPTVQSASTCSVPSPGETPAPTATTTSWW